jgi:hypothetical protein
MNISFNIDGLQEGKQYIVEFCIKENGVVIKQPEIKKKPSDLPLLEDIENENDLPKIDEIKKEKKHIKVERSWDGSLGD